MRVLLVRHGLTDWNSVGRIQGRLETPLNLYGVQQAHACAKYLKSYEFKAIYTSPQARSRQTAQIIATQHQNTPFFVADELMEINFGDWQGMTWSEISKKHGDLLKEFEKSGNLAKIYNGESYQEMQDRAYGFLSRFEREADETYLFVTHSGTIKTLICKVLGLPLERRQRFDITNLSVSTLYYSPSGGWSLTTLNETSYMDDHFSKTKSK